MRVGLTGTRHGMTPAQFSAFRGLLTGRLSMIHWFCHGDCKGADDEAATEVARATKAFIVAAPGPDGEWRANNTFSDQVLPEQSHFKRNRHIVDECEVLVACPYDPRLELTVDFLRDARGGTWYTVGYSVKKGKSLIVVWRDGTVEDNVEVK